MDASNLAIHNRMKNDYIDRIIVLLRRFGSLDFVEHNIPICVVFRDLIGRSAFADVDECAEVFYLDSIEFIDDHSFALHVAALTDTPNSDTINTVKAAHAARKPGTERRFVVCKDSYMNPPYISQFYLYPIIQILERSAQLLDGERLATGAQSLVGEEMDRMIFLEDMVSYFPALKSYAELIREIRTKIRQCNNENNNDPRQN